MTFTVNDSCLRPTRYDVIVNGERYGVVIREEFMSRWKRRIVVQWRAYMAAPETFEIAPPRPDWFSTADTMVEAVLAAFEAFTRDEDLTPDQYARISMALFEPVGVECDDFGGDLMIGGTK